MATASEDPISWEFQIYEKLGKTFEGKSVETLLRVLWYLEYGKDGGYDEGSGLPLAWKMLNSTLNSEIEFAKNSEDLAAETRKTGRDESFRRTLNQVYDQMMDGSNDPPFVLPENLFEGFDLVRETDFDLGRVTCFPTLARAWRHLPLGSQSEILQMIPDLIANRGRSNSNISAKAEVNKFMNNLADIALDTETVKNLQRWWGGEISGTRCASNIADATLPVGARIAGCVGGARLGAFAGPVGRIAGCIIGGLLSDRATRFLHEKMTESLFGIPKDEALENAYKFFGLNMNATNAEVNAAFRKMCLKHHPDKGGKAEDFILVQVNMGVIKCARGDMN